MDNNKNFQTGDTVIIQIPETNSKIIGKIEEIFQQGKEKIIRYNEFFFPEKTSAGILPHNSKYELYKTDEIEKEFYSNIIDKCEVLKFDQFIKRILSLKDKRSDAPFEKVFFVRQKYNPLDDIFTPDLPTSCYCDQIFNPDEIFIQCRECKELIHVNCFLSGETKKCFNPSCNNNIENQLSQSNREQTFQGNSDILKDKGKFVGIKRNREEIQPDLAKELIKEEKSHANLSSKTNILSDSNLKKNEDKTKVPSVEEEKTLNSYPNLSESRRKYLINLLDNLEKKNSVNKPPTLDEKSRKNIRDKISYQLLYGIEEIKEYNDFSKMKNQELHHPEIEESSAIKICNNLAVAIESAIFLHNGESINQNYKKKFQILFPNLSDYRNYELRFAILNYDLTPVELIKMSSEELAPTSLKKRRIERQEKYFKEQVLMKEEAKIIAKTHKGEAILTVDKDNSNDDYFLTAEILQKNEEKYKNKDYSNYVHEKDQNISDKGSWIYDSDNEEKKGEDVKSQKFSRENSSLSSNKLLPRTSPNPKIKSDKTLPTKPADKEKEIKYKNLTQEMQNFHNLLQEYKKENLLFKFNDKLKNYLRSETFNEILKRREEENYNTNQTN